MKKPGLLKAAAFAREAGPMPDRKLNIGQFMRTDVLCVPPDTLTYEVLKLMAQRRVGAIVVAEGDRPVGIFTERDLLRKVAIKKIDPAETLVKHVMTSELVTITPDRSVNAAYQKMTRGDFRHLLVVNGDNRIMGIISIKDLAQIREQILEIEVANKTREITEVKNQLSESLAFMEKEMVFAGNFQKQLIESRPPAFKNLRISHIYKQAASLGGDYFGVTRIDPEHAGILVVDVMGHGITSAMIAIEIKMYYDMLSSRILFPGVLITEMNKIISNLMPPGFFVAGCYGVLNLKTLHLRYTHFGLPKPGVWRRKTHKYDFLPPCQVPLGIKPDAVYPEKDTFLNPGDKLLFFTDGCVEQKDAKGRLLGDRRFLAQFKKLAARDDKRTVRELYNFVKDYSSADKLTDDLAILLVELSRNGAQ